ncbi:MAG: hypothetical protein R6X20_06255 [Phycisphaerae bacterium]
MKRSLLVLLALAAAAGCQEATRTWQRQPMPSHDRQRVFQAAQEVLERSFRIAEANITRGTIETAPALFDRGGGGTLADLRGAGGRWRRTAFVDLERSGLTVVAKVAVLLEREATDAAVAVAAQHRTAPERELPVDRPGDPVLAERPKRAVWMEVGEDKSLARELLGAIAQRVREMERDEAVPMGQSPREAADEVRRLGEQQGF